MDKASVLFTVQAFKMNLAIMPNFSQLKKSLKDMGTKIPKGLKDKVGVESLDKAFEGYQEKQLFADAIDGFSKWADKTIEYLTGVDESNFESRRGRQPANTKISLTGINGGKTLTIAEHAGELLKGSQIAKYMQGGLPEGFSQWSDLNTVLNSINKAVKDLIPEANRPKRDKKDKAKADATAVVEPTVPAVDNTAATTESVEPTTE